MHMNLSSFLLNAHERLVISILMRMNVSSFLLNAHKRLLI